MKYSFIRKGTSTFAFYNYFIAHLFELSQNLNAGLTSDRVYYTVVFLVYMIVVLSAPLVKGGIYAAQA